MADLYASVTLDRPRAARRPLRSVHASVAGMVVVALALALAALPWAGVALAGAAALAVAALALPGLLRDALAAGGLAACHRVTLLRAGLVCALAGAIAAPEVLTAPLAAWVALGVALLALALDGLDGWLARRRGQATAFGARFDMEMDAALIAVLAVLAWLSGKAGVWVLALGLMRYGFVAAALVWPWLAAPLPESFRRKAVCVLQVAVLAALLAPVVTPPVSGALALAALLALGWSFAVDVVWLWSRRHRARPQAGAA